MDTACAYTLQYHRLTVWEGVILVQYTTTDATAQDKKQEETLLNPIIYS
jgi:hypothetical protein